MTKQELKLVRSRMQGWVNKLHTAAHTRVPGHVHSVANEIKDEIAQFDRRINQMDYNDQVRRHLDNEERRPGDNEA